MTRNRFPRPARPPLTLTLALALLCSAPAWAAPPPADDEASSVRARALEAARQLARASTQDLDGWLARDRARGVRALLNHRPDFVSGDVLGTDYDGLSDDLLTAGLGASGLANPIAPAPANPLQPTAAELRRLAIHTSYRGIVDPTTAGGYGRYYGPNVQADGSVTTGEGRIAGREVLTYSRGVRPLRRGEAPANVVLMVQVPANFDPQKACIVTATSSGSRGVYGAISTGEWGLKRGCAVAYTDKGTGSAPHDLSADTVPLIDGTRAAADAAGDRAQFRAPLSDAALAAYTADHPGRYAFKHAHSQRNPERDWGRYTLQAVEFAYWVLNEQHGVALPHGYRLRTIRPSNTTVIASSISNGGGAAIAAAEQDDDRLIDAVVVSEPAIEMPADPDVVVRRGGQRQPTIARTLFDFTTHAQLYQYCAAMAPSVAGTPGAAFVSPLLGANRCASLQAAGLLAGTTTAELGEAALAQMQAYGWEPESAVLQASLAAFEVAPAVAVTFGHALARASVADPLCGYGFSATTSLGTLAPLDAGLLASMAATGNGVPPSVGVQLINERNPGAPVRDLLSLSPSTGALDMNLDGARCLRNLLTGRDAASRALQRGLDETRRDGNLHGKPALIVHGRADALLPVNHTSRPYTALNAQVEGRRSRLRYLEVTNAQHFDGFIGLPAVLPGYDTRYVPLHLYLVRALDAMADHLWQGAPLPPSQVVRTTPRGGTPGAAPALADANVPPIATVPAAGDRIRVQGRTLVVPD